MKKYNAKITTIKIVVMSLYISITFALQVALKFIPNIELVTFMIGMAGIIYTWKISIPISIIFVVLEMLIAPFGAWLILYLFIWPLLVLIMMSLRNIIKKHWWLFGVICGIFGLLFGSVDTVINILLFGKEAALAYWIVGIPWDIIHCISNTVIGIILYQPIIKLFDEHLYRFVF